MGQRVVNDAGDELELIDNQWVPVGPAGAKAKGQEAPGAPAGPRESLLSPGSKFDQFGEAMAVSAGDQFATAGRNIRDVYAMLRGDDKARNAIVDERAEAAKIRERFRGESPVASFIGGLLPTAPLMLLSGGTAAPGLMGAAKLAGGQALSSAAQGALLSESGDYGTDAAIGGGMSLGMSAASQIVSRVMNGRAAVAAAGQGPGGALGAAQTASGLNQGERDVLEGAKRAGLQITPGQETGNLTYRKIEAGMAANPFLGKFFDDIEQGNKAQLNRLAARAMGQEADNIGAGVLMDAEQAIGDKFKTVGQRLGRVDIDPLIASVEDMAKAESTRGMPRTQIKQILNTLKGGQKERALAVGAEEGRFITGQEMMDMRSVMSDNMRTAYGQGDHVLGKLYGEVLEKYDDAIEEAATALARKGGPDARDTIGLYGQARQQWNAYRAAISGGATPDGNVMPAQMARLMKGGDASGYQGRVAEDGTRLLNRGSGLIGENPTGDLYDALRFFTGRIGKPAAPNTGGTVGAFNQWMNSGGTVPAIAKGGMGMLASPLMKAYANQSPLAAQAMLFTHEALTGAAPMGGNGFAMAQQAARTAQQAVGGLGGF